MLEPGTQVQARGRRGTGEKKAAKLKVKKIATGVMRSTLNTTVEAAYEQSRNRMRYIAGVLAKHPAEAGIAPYSLDRFATGHRKRWLDNPAKVVGLHHVLEQLYLKSQVSVVEMEDLFVRSANEFLDYLRQTFPALEDLPSSTITGQSAVIVRDGLLRHLPVVQFHAQAWSLQVVGARGDMGGTGGRRPTLCWMSNPRTMPDAELLEAISVVVDVPDQRPTHELERRTLELLNRSISSEMRCVTEFLVASCLPGEDAARLGVPINRQKAVRARFSTISAQLETIGEHAATLFATLTLLKAELNAVLICAFCMSSVWTWRNHWRTTTPRSSRWRTAAPAPTA